jgi:hypothetical protein
VELDIFGFVMAYGEFSLVKDQVEGVNDGSYDAQAQTGIAPFDAEVLSLNLESVHVFAGTGGAFVRDAQGVPTGFAHAGAVGLYGQGANLAVTILQNKEDPAQRYVGIESTLKELGLEGIEKLTFKVSAGVVRINWASQGERLNWVQAYENDQSLPYKKLAHFTELTPDVQLQIHGQMDVDVFGFHTGSFTCSRAKSRRWMTAATMQIPRRESNPLTLRC